MIKNGDSEGFAGGILQLINNPELAKRLGNNARMTALNYSWNLIAQEIEEVYEKVVQIL